VRYGKGEHNRSCIDVRCPLPEDLSAPLARAGFSAADLAEPA